MDKNEKMLTMAKALWITGIIVEIGVLSYPLFLHSAHLRKLFGYPTMQLTVSLEVTSGILVLVSVGIIAGIFQKRKPFYLLLAAVLTKFIWMSLQMPIYKHINTIYKPSQQGVISMARKILLFQMLPDWIIQIIVATLVLIAFLEIAALFNDNLFKLSGILILISAFIYAIYGPINYAFMIHNYTSSHLPTISAQALNKISNTVTITRVSLMIIALIVLIAAVIHIEAPLKHNQTESTTNA